jgi:V8-like Glu-specific endopeptidase
VNLLPLLCAKLFAPITALGTALATVLGLPAGPEAQPQLAAMARPDAVLTGHGPLWPRTGRQFAGTPQVGALVWQNPDGTPGTKLCSAVAVDSPAGDLIATAAHCVAGVTVGLGGPLTVAYVPEYQPGQAPYGVWYPTQITVAPQWAAQQDPNYDLAFINVTRPTSTVPLEQVTGAERFGGAVSVGTLGVLLGYPNNTSGPVGCREDIERESATQLRFDCADFPVGTSGGPLLTGVDPLTGIGTLAGVIGGYQLGGDRDDVSYAAALGPSLAALYRQAAAADPASLSLVLHGVL